MRTWYNAIETCTSKDSRKIRGCSARRAPARTPVGAPEPCGPHRATGKAAVQLMPFVTESLLKRFVNVFGARNYFPQKQRHLCCKIRLKMR